MEKKNVIDKLIDIIKETEEQNKILQSQNTGWRKELRERFDWTQNTTIKGKIELEKFIEQELDKAREEGRTMAIHEISKTLDTEITRWRSDEDGEFDVLRIGFRYFRSKDADDYYSSIEAIGEEDFKDYESI